MKNMALALALVLAGSSLPSGWPPPTLMPVVANLKQALATHPMAGKHRDLMKQCKAEYKAHKKAGGARPT